MGGVFARHYAWMSSMIFLAILIVGISFVAVANTYITDHEQTKLARNAEIFSDLAASYLVENGQLDYRYRLSLAAMDEMQDYHFLISDATGTIFLCSDPPGCRDHIGKKIPDSLLDTLQNTGATVTQGNLGGLYPAKFSTAAHSMAVTDGEVVGYVLASAPSSDVGLLMSAFIRIFLVVAAVALLLSCLSAYLVSLRMTRPLKAMSQSAQRYAQGDFSPRVPVDCRAQDEVTLLCMNFNTMADSLQELEELRRGFIANVSHELRTPMTVISGYVDGILDGTIPPASEKQYLTIIREEVMRLSRLVARMLDITQMQTNQMAYTAKPVNLCEILRRVILGFETRIEEKELNVEVTLPDDDVEVMFDPDALMQVVTNLTDNAIKFAPPSGILAVLVGVKGSRALVSICNSGPQIPSHDIPFVFDRFHKADKARSNDRQGLGLGLYIVKSILQSHKESIQVESDNGLTTFTFTVTICKPDNSRNPMRGEHDERK